MLKQESVPWPVRQITTLQSYTVNESALLGAAAANGFMTTLPDVDGVMRRTPLLMHYKDNVYGSLSEEMARLYYLLDRIEIKTGLIGDVATPESLQFGSVSVPIDASGRALIPYRGKSPALRYISASDVTNGKLPPETFTNKLVLVGATALGLGGIVLAVILPLLSPLWLLALSLAIAAALTGVNAWFWGEQQLALDLALPLLQVTLLAALNVSFGFVRETDRRRTLKSMFGHYVPPQLVDMMMDENENFSIEGQSRDMTYPFPGGAKNEQKDYTNASKRAISPIIDPHESELSRKS